MFFSTRLLWNDLLAPMATKYACQTVTLFGVVGLILPTMVVLYLLELRLRCRFVLRTTISTVVPDVQQLLLQQGLLLSCLTVGLVLSSWETLVLLVSQHHTNYC